MSDSNTYFNAFVDAAVGSIHEYVALTLQLKAKLKLANDLLSEIININNRYRKTDRNNSSIALQNELNVVRNQLNESKLIEESFHGMKNKIQHMNTLTKQYSDLKSQYASLIEQHNLDKAKLEKFMSASEIKPSKKVINTKVKQKETKDDF